MNPSSLAFVGGGNMAGAILGGLLQDGRPADRVLVVEPQAPAREALAARWPGLQVMAQADARLGEAALMVWAVKPQLFQAAAAPCRPFVGQALQLSVMAGLRSDAIAAATGSGRVVRSMPNTPALIGQGMTGLFAREAVTDDERRQVEQVLSPTGRLLWVRREEDLDAVTALSGSGPAYVFYFVEAMMQAAEAMGLSAEEGRQLALGTFAGATALAQQSTEPPAVLRERVTSKGGTTQAALLLLESRAVKQHFIDALQAARQRAVELGDEFGGA